MIKYLIAYLFVCIFSYIIVKGKLRLTHYSGSFDNKELNNTPRKMSLLSMIVVSVIFTLYNVYVTRSTGVLGSDRLNYKANFDGMQGMILQRMLNFYSIYIYQCVIRKGFYL